MYKLSLKQVLSNIVAEQDRPLVLGIGGGECTGKSFITDRIREVLKAKGYDVVVLPLDGYLSLSRQERDDYDATSKHLSILAKHIGDHPDCFEFDQLQKDIQTILTTRILKNPRRYDYDEGKVVRDLPDIAIHKEKTVIIVEGLFSLHGNIANSLQSKIFICANDAVSWERYRKRHEERGKDDKETIQYKFKKMVVPSYHEYIAPTAMYADYVAHNNGRVITFHKRCFNAPKLIEEHTSSNRSNRSTKGIYRVFLTYNIEDISGWINKEVRKIANDEDIEIVISGPGDSAENPAEDVRAQLEEAEGLVAIIRRDTNWVSNEIGMAYALHLPICAIVDQGVSVGGILNLITERTHIQTDSPDDVSDACKNMFSVLKTEIEKHRRQLPEPPYKGCSVIRVSWWKYYQLIQIAYKRVEKVDPDKFHRGYAPTLLLGITRGGIIAADILSRLSSDREIGLLRAKRRDIAGQVLYDEEPIKTLLKLHCIKQKHDGKQVRILVIDDVMKSGKSLIAAMETIERVLCMLDQDIKPDFMLESLVLISQGEPSRKPYKPDYVIESVPEDTSIILPYGRG